VEFNDNDIQTIYNRLGVPIQADACIDGVESTEEEFKRRLKITINDVVKTKKEIALRNCKKCEAESDFPRADLEMGCRPEIVLGNGNTAITAAKHHDEVVVVFERGIGTGVVGEPPKSRPVGSEVDLKNINGFYVTVLNIESYNALQKILKDVEQMLTAKRQAESDRIASIRNA
jgi:hypothetical protein